MRINVTDVNGGYKVLDIDEIESGAKEISHQVDELIEYGLIMKSRIVNIRDDFDTINFDRTESCIETYLIRAQTFQAELTELIQSVEKYRADKENRWS